MESFFIDVITNEARFETAAKITSLSRQQDKNVHVDLSAFCPVSCHQFGATAYAYAVAYTALSAQYNIAKNITDRKIIEADAFSEGFVAAMVRAALPLWMMRRIKDTQCSYSGTAEKALKVLREYGCPMRSHYDWNCKEIADDDVLADAALYRIRDYKTLTDNYDTSNEACERLIAELLQGRPVITSVYQTDEFHDARGVALLSDLNPQKHAANHVVCILGFDSTLFDGAGAFKVKNNYADWGTSGFSWVQATDFLHLVESAFSIVL